ncbi:MAG TPA: NUDIX domain-containing protein [Patescibacteria group bacterium]
MNDIHKAAGIIIQNRKLLVERSIGKEFFISPGGSIEEGETPETCLIRELHEEFTIKVQESDLEFFGEFTSEAVNHPGRMVHLKVFVVTQWESEPTPSSEVEELAWITSAPPRGMKLGSIFAHEILPRLKALNLID